MKLRRVDPIICSLYLGGTLRSSPRVHQNGNGPLLADALQTVTLLGTPTVGLRTLAADVLDASYRRHFAHTAADLTRASAEAPTDALFEILLSHGRAMRRETERRAALTSRGGEQA